jgi:PilZ domain
MRNERRQGAPRVQFDPPLKLTMMAIDGTWVRGCLLMDVSDSGAQITLSDPRVPTEEFFLLLSSSAKPAFRRCKRAWLNGDLVGVSFDKMQAAKPARRLARDFERAPV